MSTEIDRLQAEAAVRAQQEVRVQTSVAEVTGILPNGDVITQAVPVRHPLGAEDGMIMGIAWGFVKQAGALLVETEGHEIDYYILSKFDKLHMKVNRVSLVGPA